MKNYEITNIHEEIVKVLLNELKKNPKKQDKIPFKSLCFFRKNVILILYKYKTGKAF